MTAPRGRSASSPALPEQAGGFWSAAGTCVLLALVSLVAYHPALHGDLLWDDASHVTRPDLQSLHGLGRIWFEIGATQQYYPLLHSAFWLEHRLWGDATPGYHLVNLLLHVTAAFLFGRVLRRLAIPGATFAAFLFALHPVMVESVAWISEQKNTLSAVFYLAAALAYLRFDATRGRGMYALASLLFLLALLTKTVTATLPAALLVVFWWKRGKIDWRRDVLPLAPWLIAGAAGGLFTAHFEKVLIGAQGAEFDLGFLERGLLAGRVLCFYLGHLMWPANLIFIYPHWTVDAAVWWQWLFPVGFGVLLVVLGERARRQRAPLAALLLFAGTLFPVLGFFNIYPFVFSYVADHFQYLASLGPFALAAAGLAGATARLAVAGRLAVQGGILFVLGLVTWSQSGIYRDGTTLYEATLRKNPSCWMAHHNLAMALTASGHVDEAVTHLLAVRSLKPDYAPAANNLGDDYVQLGQIDRAIPQFKDALRLQPNYAVAERNLGYALAASGHNAEAIPHFARAVELQPDYAEAESNWGVALMLTGRFPEAIPHFEKSIALDPSSADRHELYGRALAANHRPTDASRQLAEAVRLAPDQAEFHLTYAQLLRELGQQAEAQTEFQRAIELNPDLANGK